MTFEWILLLSFEPLAVAAATEEQNQGKYYLGSAELQFRVLVLAFS
jgi:hypothetical protein